MPPEDDMFKLGRVMRYPTMSGLAVGADGLSGGPAQAAAPEENKDLFAMGGPQDQPQPKPALKPPTAA